MFKYFYVLFSVLTISLSSFGQTTLNGAQVSCKGNPLVRINSDSLLLNNNAYLYQSGTLLIDKDFVVLSGKSEINGLTIIKENLLNNDSIVGLNATSQIDLEGNWTNNSIFIPGMNTTRLSGGIQEINGLANTNFFNLDALGSINDVKQLQGVDVSVANIFNLGDVEFATKQNTLKILNPQLNAIIRLNGFVSSLGIGRLERTTNSLQSYLFPTGSSLGTTRYRPISIRPDLNDTLVYGVRMVNGDPNMEGLDRFALSDSLCEINPFFYHKIYGNEAANIVAFYLNNEDGYWSTIAHWENSIWEDTAPTTAANANNFDQIELSNWSNFTSENFALGNGLPYLILDNEIEAYEGELVNFNPFFSGNPDDPYSWNPIENLDCSNCLSPSLIATNSGYYTIQIDVSPSCIIIDSIWVNVNANHIIFPTAFTPNQDGVNDYFLPMNSNIEYYNIEIYNRWGELIYKSENPLLGWNGEYKNNKAMIGVYNYTVSYQLKNQEKLKTHKGNFTLIR